LGDVQWKWFEEVIKMESDLILVLSSIQVLATEHVFERWNLFPHERSKIIKILNSVDTKSLIISGDRHKGGLYKKESLVELTSSSLNKPVKAARISNILRYVPEFIVNFIPKSTRELLVENDKLLRSQIYNFENFGLIKINTESEEVEISLNDINGNNIFADKI
jgi:alkaline phosphatase D